MKYTVYATTEHGQGRVQALGEYDDPTDIEIVVGMFDKDVIINISHERFGWDKVGDQSYVDEFVQKNRELGQKDINNHEE